MGVDGTQTHGHNAVLSMIEWALNKRGAEAAACTIHADNCPGYNVIYNRTYLF